VSTLVLSGRACHAAACAGHWALTRRRADGHLSPHTSLSCLIALDDVHLDNGPVRVVAGSHLDGQRALDDGTDHAAAAAAAAAATAAAGRDGQGAAENFKEANGSRVIAMDMGGDEGTPVTMARGQVLVMHCHMMHCSQPNLSDRPRRILFTRYADADAVEAYNPGAPPRLGRLLCGHTRFPEVAKFGTKRERGKERGIDRQADRQAGRQAGRQTDRQTDRQAGRQAAAAALCACARAYV
jgi:ectoine hydroxylase-related dioxygenase (phytanoyl-CoA dioxygenase family)